MEGTASTPSTGSTTTGPTSFSDASLTWSDAPSASAPATESTPADPSAATTTPPAETTPVEGQPQQGEPPKERWNDILANARTKATQEATAQFEQQYGWAKQVNPQEFQQIQRIAAKFSGGDPINGLQELIAEIRKDPQYDAQLKSLAARALSQRSAPAPQEPQMVQVQLEDGSVVPMPRDPAAWLEHQKQQWLAQVKQEFQPVTKTIETLQQREAQAAQQQQIAHFATSTYQDVTTWPSMDSKESQSAVAKELASAQIDPNDVQAVQLALNAAYRKVVLPTLSKSTEAKLLDSLKTRAAASTSVNPGSAAPSTSRTVTRFDQLGADAWR